jgi:hypothetical protein
MNEYLQKLIQGYDNRDFKHFAAYIYTTLQGEIDASRTKKQKDKYILIRKQILRYIVTNQNTVTRELQSKK